MLCYHAVSDSWECELAVTEEQLECQVGSLLRRGYRPATFLEVATGRADPPALAVTFDDAYRSVYELARPVLRELGAIGSVYAPTDWIGSARPMRWVGIERWGATADAPELTPMDWPALGALADEGWEVGSHTRSHAHLTGLGEKQLTEELSGSRSACEAGLGRPCETLAYPYGDVDDRVVAATAAAGYTAAAALPAVPHGVEKLRWPRVGIYRWDGRARFRLKSSPLLGRLRALPLRRVLDPVGRLTRSRSSR